MGSALRLASFVTVRKSKHLILISVDDKTVKLDRTEASETIVERLISPSGLDLASQSLFRSSVSRFLIELCELGWLQSGLEFASRWRGTIFERSLPVLQAMHPAGGDPVALLQKAEVAIIGVGGLGSVAAQCLVQAGVGHLMLLDNDVVETSNLNRQALYSVSSVGHSKVGAAASELSNLQPDVSIKCFETTIRDSSSFDVISGADFVILTADNPAREIKRWMSAWGHTNATPYAMAGVGVLTGFWGPIVEPGDKPYTCLDKGDPDTRQSEDGAADLEHTSHLPWSLSTTNMVIASLLAHDVIAFLVGARDMRSIGRPVFFDFRTSRIIYS